MSEINKKELSDAEIASKTGFGETAEELETPDNTTEDEESSDIDEETEDEPAVADESEEEEEEQDEPAPREKRQISKEDDEEDESIEDEGESDEEEPSDKKDSDTSFKTKDKRTVPYSALKDAQDKITSLQADLAKARESGTKEDIKEATEEVENAAKELGEELGIDKDGIAKILRAAVKLSSKDPKLPKEIVDKLKTLDEIEAKNKEEKEAAHFKNEWESLDIRGQYPNATKATIKEAQDLMDKLAHSKEHHQHDLDYILFKNKAKFDTILKTAPKSKSGESTKKIGQPKQYEDDKEDDEELVDIEDLNPSIMKQREQKDLEMRNSHRHDKDYKIFSPMKLD